MGKVYRVTRLPLGEHILDKVPEALSEVLSPWSLGNKILCKHSPEVGYYSAPIKFFVICTKASEEVKDNTDAAFDLVELLVQCLFGQMSKVWWRFYRSTEDD